MKLYQFLLLFTFCSVLINAYSINSDIPLPENLRKFEMGDKEDLCINIPWRGDEYVTNCRYRHSEQNVYCDIKGSKLYVIIPIIETFGEIKNDINITEWHVVKKTEVPFEIYGPKKEDYRYVDSNEIMETGAFESIEVGDNYHGQYYFELIGDDLYIQLFYDRIVIDEY